VTPDQLKAIRARAEAATPGPWRFQAYVSDPGRPEEFGIAGASEIDGCPTLVSGDGFLFEEKDARFVAHARTDVPALLAALEAAQALNREAAKMLRGLAYSACNGPEVAPSAAYMPDDVAALLFRLEAP
jgi:hypothetical protein